MGRIPTYIALLALTASLLFSCGGRPRLRGHLKGLPDGRVSLVRLTPDGWSPVGSAIARNGRFSMRMPNIIPDILILRLRDGCDLPLIITGEELTVEGNLYYREDPVVRGSHENCLLAHYRATTSPLQVRLEAVGMLLRPYADSVSLADSATYYRLLDRRRLAQQELNAVRTAFVRNHPASIVAAMVVAGEASAEDPAQRLDSLIGTLDAENMEDNVFLRRLQTRRGSLRR